MRRQRNFGIISIDIAKEMNLIQEKDGFVWSCCCDTSVFTWWEGFETWDTSHRWSQHFSKIHQDKKHTHPYLGCTKHTSDQLYWKVSPMNKHQGPKSWVRSCAKRSKLVRGTHALLASWSRPKWDKSHQIVHFGCPESVWQSLYHLFEEDVS